MKIFVLLGSIFALIGVAAGAYGAHGLPDHLGDDMVGYWQTAVQYQMYHALALFGAAWLHSQTEAISALVAGWCFAAGILVFSGSLYILVLTGSRGLGAVTPVGGLAMMIGWLGCILAALKLGST